MTITRVGATDKYATGWDQAFGVSKKSAAKSGAKAAAKGATPKKKVAKKKSAKKKSK